MILNWISEPDTLKVASDTLQIISDTSNTFSWASIFAMAKNLASALASIATIIGIFVGLYYGHKGLKKYLIDDHVKSKFSEIRNRNKEISDLVTEIINEVKEKEPQVNGKEDITKYDLIYINSITKKIYKTASGASQPVATLAYFLDQTLSTISIGKINNYKNFHHKPTPADLYLIIYNCCKKIFNYANKVVDVPEKIELEPINDLKSNYQEFINESGFFFQ